MSRQLGPEALRESREDEAELQLAQTLVALHRAQRAPRAVERQVEARLARWSEPRSGRAGWAPWLEPVLRLLAGWPAAAVVAVVLLLLVTWQQRDAERREAAEEQQRSRELAGTEVTLRGVAVPGSLHWRMYGDDIGMGHCEGKFLLALEEAAHEPPVLVHWTRCDLPDALSAELQRLFSPARGAPALPVTARGHWARANEFEALGVRLQP